MEDGVAWTSILPDGFDVAGPLEFAHEGVAPEKLVYKIAAVNEWGTGPYSRPNLEIDIA